MKLQDLVNPSEIQDALDKGLLRIREDGEGLRILNYTDAAMYTKGAWDNMSLRQCRGLIVDEADNIRARGFTKFFNYGQEDAVDLDMDAPVEVTDKVDGSLGICYYNQVGLLRIATRGSFNSEQALHATERLEQLYPNFKPLPEYTVLVEIIYPENRIVLDYQSMDDLVLLGAINNVTGTIMGPKMAAESFNWDGPITDTMPYQTLRDALMAPPRKNAEGMVVRFIGSGQMVKLKQEDYIRLHRIVTGLNERSVWERLVAGTPPLEDIPDELHNWVTRVVGGLQETTNELAESTHALYTRILNDIGDVPETEHRREFAKRATTWDKDLTSFLFLMYDDRDVEQAILKSLKPRGDVRFKPVSEDTA